MKKMLKNLKRGASSVGGIIGIVIVILVLILGAYYFWQYKIGPRLHEGGPIQSTTTPQNEVEINLTATTT